MRNSSFRRIDERCPVAIDKQVEVPRGSSANTIKRRGKNKLGHYWYFSWTPDIFFFCASNVNENEKLPDFSSISIYFCGINSLSLSPPSGRISSEKRTGRESGGKEGGGGGGGEVTQCSAFTLRNLLDDRT